MYLRLVWSGSLSSARAAGKRMRYEMKEDAEEKNMEKKGEDGGGQE